MRRASAVCQAAVGFLLLFTGRAEAETWWDFLEALSGPGPFRGRNYATGDVYCLEQPSTDARGSAARSDDFKPALIKARPNWFGRSRLPQTLDQVGNEPCIYFDYAGLRSEPDAKYPFSVQAHFLETGVGYRILPAVEVGAGAGVLRLVTDMDAVTRSVHRLTVTPVRVKVMPLFVFRPLRKRTWPAAFQVYYRQSFIAGSLDGEDFGIPREQFSENGEFVRSFGLRIDVTKFFRF